MKNILKWVAVLSVLGFGLWTWPQYKSLKEGQDTLALLIQQKETITASLKALQDQNKVQDSQAALLANLDRRVPERIDQELFLSDIQRIVEGSGFAYEGLSFNEQPALDSSWHQIEAHFGLSGPKATLLTLLRNIEKNPRLMTLKAFNFNTEEVNGIEIVRLHVSLTSFSQTAVK